MEFDFSGKRVIVTGAGRGIGRELSKKLAKCGAQVIAISRTASHLESLKSEIPAIEIVSVDVADWKATTNAVEAIGHVDMLVNNAAIGGEGPPFGRITEEYFDQTVSINLKGSLNIAQIVSNKMKEKGSGGVIVNVSSVLATKALANHAVYSASKAALDQLTRVMAIELGPHKIRVNTINPTLVNTDMVADVFQDKSLLEAIKSSVPIRNVCEPVDVVNAIVFLLSDFSSMVHGSSLYVDGGQNL